MTVHHFETDDAAEHGLIGAVLLYNIRFWIAHNRANDQNQFAGRTWTFNSAKAFAELFPYLSEDQIQRTLKKLVDGDVLLRRVLAQDKWNRTNWYAFVDEDGQLAALKPVTPDSAKSRNGRRETAVSTPRARGIDAVNPRDLCTDVNADENHISFTDDVAARPDWFVEAQGAGDPPPVDQSAATKLAVALRSAGINCAAAHPLIQTLAEQGVAVDTAVSAAQYAKEAKPGEKIGLAYVARILESWAKSAATANVAGSKVPSAKPKHGRWWLSDETALAVAKEVGVGQAHPTESRDAWHARIKAAIENGGAPPPPRPHVQAIPIAETAGDQQRTAMPEDARRALLDLAKRSSVSKLSTEVR